MSQLHPPSSPSFLRSAENSAVARCLCVWRSRSPSPVPAKSYPSSRFLAGRDDACVLYLRISAALPSRRSRPACRGRGEGGFLAFCFPVARASSSFSPPFALLSRPHDLFRGRSEAGVAAAALGKLLPASLPCARRKSPSDALVSRAWLFGVSSCFLRGNETELPCCLARGGISSRVRQGEFAGRQAAVRFRTCGASPAALGQVGDTS